MMYPLFAVFSPVLAIGAALAAIGVPLVIHLLFRKRYQIVPWAAIRFLFVAERRHKRRIDQWLLLVIRALVLLLLLFAMIAPTPWAERLWQAIRPGATQTVVNVPRTHHVIVLDASLSMTARADDGHTRFERAVTQAEDLIRSGNPGDGYTLIVLADTPQTVVRGPSSYPEEVVAELRKVKPTYAHGDHTATLSSVADVLARSPPAYPRRQLTFFTDLQRASWIGTVPRPENNTAELWQRIAARADIAIVDTAHRDLDNLAISEMALADPMPLVDSSVSLTVTVANLGSTEKQNVRVELLVGRPSASNEGLASFEQKPIDVIPPGGRQSITFTLDGAHRFRDRGIHVLQAKLVEGDDLPGDDTRSIAVEVRDGLHALLVDGQSHPDPWRRAATHLHTALFPRKAKPTLTPVRLTEDPVTPDTFLNGEKEVREFPSGKEVKMRDFLSKADCVFFCDVLNPTPEMAAKLDAVLHRGGTVVIGLGPNTVKSRDQYNAVFYRDGTGILPGPLGDVVSVSGLDEPSFQLVADDEEFRKMPLAPFGHERVRPGLITVPFRAYQKLDAPVGGRARRILSFARVGTSVKSTTKPDAALVEWNRHRGRVVVFTSTFNEDWNDWPALLTYLPFWHELLKYSVANPNRYTLRVGEPIEEFFPAASANATVGLNGPEGLSASTPLLLQDEAGVAVFKNTVLPGLYRLGIDGSRDRVFAVNVAEVVPGTPSESDLRQINEAEFKSIGPVQIIPDSMSIKASEASGAVVITSPKQHGPWIARLAVTAAVLLLALELVLAWRLGPSHAAGATGNPGRASDRKWFLRLLGTTLAFLPLAVAAFVLFTIFHEQRTGNLLGFLPYDVRTPIQNEVGVPPAAPGEETQWRLEHFTAYFRNAVTDRRVVAALAIGCLALTFAIYWLERRAAGGLSRVIMPALLRCAVFLLALFVLLGQTRLTFNREGWPEVVILLDTSASMAKAEDFKDPAVRAKAEELVGATGLSEVNRLRLAQLLLTRKDADWLDRLLREKKVKVHIYTIDSQTRMLTTVEEADQVPQGRDAILNLKAEGNESKLGTGVEDVLKAFNGSKLAAIIMFTDGITTSGNTLPESAHSASLRGVPLFLIGTGDPWETPDLILSDPQSEDVVGRGDRLVFEARLTAHGQVPPMPIPVVLYEQQSGQLIERGRATVTPDLNGNPVTITVAHTPMEVGEKTFVLVAQPVPGEKNVRNNELERTVLVTDSRRINVLYVEGYPRYDFRYVKVMLERESDKSLGGKAVEVKVILLDAETGWAGTDRSAFGEEFPNRSELFGFDVVILGDVDPKQLGPRAERKQLSPRAILALRDLSDFVKLKGGGLLFLSGQHGTPAAYLDTPLADVLPVTPSERRPATRPPEEQPIETGFQPKLTDAGRQHPLFRFSPDETESARIWSQLQPLYWFAKGYRRKPLSSVLAVHPELPAEGIAGENHPLVIQQFAGAGPVLFFGFDDTWRWRFRNDEEYFDRFWMQAMRTLSRSRIRRPEVRVLPKTDFRRGEKVTVQVRFPIEAPAPANDTVRVTMTRSPLLKPDGTPHPGPTITDTFTLARVSGPTVQFEYALPRAPDGEYRFELTSPEVPGAPPFATARVLPPLDETERYEMNITHLKNAASISGGKFYTLANADEVFNDLTNLQSVPLNQPCPPISLWNQPPVYLLVILLLLAEWLLRKRERLL